MVLLPVVERELRVAARGRALYRVRFYAVLLMTGVFAWSMYSMQQEGLRTEMGLEILAILAACTFGLSLLMGVVETSDCVSVEKREGTLGLLFLTDLRGYDVIGGKLAANSLGAFYALLAVLPVLGIPLLIGGVTFGQFARLGLVLVTTLVLSLSVGIFVSTYSRNERKAMFFTALILLTLTFLPVLLTTVYAQSRNATSPADLWEWMMFCPGFGAIQAIVPGTGWPAETYWYSIAWNWGLAITLAGMACAHVANSWEETGAEKKPRQRSAEVRIASATRNPRGRALLERNPFVWLAMRGEASPRRVWLLVSSLFCVWLIAVLRYGVHWAGDPDLLTPLLGILNMLLKIWIAGEACRRFVEDRNNNTMEFLLSTPLSERQIVDGQWRALLKQFGFPIAAVAVWELFLAAHLRHPDFWFVSSVNGPSPEALMVSRVVFLVLDAIALAWMGMWLGCACRGRTRAMLGSLGLVMLAPTVFTGLCFHNSEGDYMTGLVLFSVVLASAGVLGIRPFLIRRLRAMGVSR